MLSKPQTCLCGDEFTPRLRARGVLTHTCGRPKCRGQWASRHGRTTNVKAIEAAKQKARQRIFDQTWARFGQLTEREAAIFAFARARGYQDGQNASRRKVA